ncbi:hypothetical protein C8J57DRAFT_1257842 [Mycena rebaudengoi]|nr:hypothetical protein C8J57DRAFT_1257842 [Mycena rebaudengoi]
MFCYMHPEHVQFVDSLMDSEDDGHSCSKYIITTESETGYQTEASGANSEAKEPMESEVEQAHHKVYLVLPKKRGMFDRAQEMLKYAERTTPQTCTMRCLVFDGVHLPSKEAMQNQLNNSGNCKWVCEFQKVHGLPQAGLIKCL